MKIGRIDGRPVLLHDGQYADVKHESAGRFSTTRQIFEAWSEFREWASTTSLTWLSHPSEPTFGPPHDDPGQVFGVGLNYAEHRDEVMADLGVADSALPALFTKFPSAIAGPHDDVELSSDRCDYEIELVVVIGKRADRISPDEGWDHVAGLTIGQDISDRQLQYANPNQWSLAKSVRTFAPIGPLIVTPDEFGDRDDIRFECWVNGESRQKSSTRQLIRGVAEIVSLISQFTPLRAGDLVFTGTPAGVGHRMEPPRLLAAGDVIESRMEGIGAMVNRCVPGFRPLSP